ncbi:DmsE family decaheme c-type cytochrome [Granulicella sp. 5B5]|uniref:DmsE family decaheme c-type cytochrome n=1 Tax=Granulicella sp. 5B5 TaxID=1617967 RepID=UPI0015F47E05|nr:DmsE family decaheme c-type cytochrome [Granulicella sp. 5B5]QMV19893.1 DmsE family decaheme c-type cytochrome [Granulicella sp. 5B5]
MKRFLVCVALIALIPCLWETGSVDAASGKKQRATLTQKMAAPNSADFVGSETCATCHADVANRFSTNPHSRLALMHNGKGATCESCHGPGKAHVDSGGDITKIFRFSQASAQQIDATCLGCHEGAHPDFERSPHGKAGLSCTSCHSVHSFASEASLLKVSQPTLCYTCHTDVKPAFAQPFHHKVDEGLMQCSDCHDPHGTFEDKQLKSTPDQNAVCTKCHTETAGPFVYEHPVIKTEGCTTCHSPHGSPNARLLNVSNINTLCLQCHSGTNMGAFPHAVSPTGPVHNQAAQYVACTNCHTQIHGSNASPQFFK